MAKKRKDSEYLGDDVRYRHLKGFKKFNISYNKEQWDFIREYERKIREEGYKPSQED